MNNPLALTLFLAKSYVSLRCVAPPIPLYPSEESGLVSVRARFIDAEIAA